jgi:ATP-dependent helicase/nuclease subunit B
MLNLYYGRADVDKDRFLFAQIGKQLEDVLNNGEGQIMLIVPDQYTLQAERNAFTQLALVGIMDLEILSFSRLSFKVLSETGGTFRTFVDKYGRHMSENKPSLTWSMILSLN